MHDVITFGAATVDVFVSSDKFTLKDNLLSIPASSKSEMKSALIASGGGATNAAVAFSRLGLKSAAVSLLGNDPLSLYVFKDLEADRVDTSILVHQDGETTDYSVILVDPSGGRSIITNRGRSRLEEKHLQFDSYSASWFYITSVEGNLDLLEKLIGFAVDKNIKIALNPGNRELSQASRLTPFLQYVDFLLLNGIESEMLTGCQFDDHHFWSKLSSFKSQIVAVTKGRDGAFIQSGDQKLFSPIINTSPVDETGAGDGFGSTFVAGLHHQLPLDECLFWAIKNSAAVVSVLGAKPGLLTLDQIKK